MDAPLDLVRRFPGFEALNTPQVVVDAEVLASNIARMQAVAGTAVALHPHIKTHKSAAIARMQRDAGAAGFTAARPNEVAMLLSSGLGPVTLAYPMIDAGQIRTLLENAGNGEIRFIADSPLGVEALAAAAKTSGRTLSVFIKVDVGLHRCGVAPESDAALNLARPITAQPGLRFLGLLSHAGQAYGAGNPEGIRGVARQELEIMASLRARLSAAGIPVDVVSVGSTPTIFANAGFDGVDEIRPGNYAFCDLTAVRLGIASRNDVALGVAARVVSANSQYAIVNVGSKTLSSDLGAHGSSTAGSYGEVWVRGKDRPLAIAKLSEEHAFISLEGRALAIGMPVLILPNHSCPVANLSGGMHLLSQREESTLLTIDARSNDQD
jgi:D-serine deaminase-like pyridoxal phosphate-dependent protein